MLIAYLLMYEFIQFRGILQDLGWALIGSAWMMAGSVATAACARTMGESAKGPWPAC